MLEGEKNQNTMTDNQREYKNKSDKIIIQGNELVKHNSQKTIIHLESRLLIFA